MQLYGDRPDHLGDRSRRLAHRLHEALSDGGQTVTVGGRCRVSRARQARRSAAEATARKLILAATG